MSGWTREDVIDAVAFEGIGVAIYDEPGAGRVQRYSRWKQGACPECREPMRWTWRNAGQRVLSCVNPECSSEPIP